MALDFSKHFAKGNVIDNEGKEVTFNPDDHEVIGLYFSAHWCPPCRGFTPVLAKYYKALKDKNRTLEIIFISSDRDEPSFKEYLGEMPWLALNFANRDEKNELAKLYGVTGIPTLVFLKKDGNTVTKDGRGAVMSDKDHNMAWFK